MDITKLEIGDITDELILQHYDLDVERKSKYKNDTRYIYIMGICEGEIFDFLNNWQKAYDKVIDDIEVPNGYHFTGAVLVPVEEYEYTNIEVRIRFSHLETDEEVLQRLFGKIRRDIKKYKKLKVAKVSAEEEERKLYEELKNKYEN